MLSAVVIPASYVVEGHPECRAWVEEAASNGWEPAQWWGPEPKPGTVAWCHEYAMKDVNASVTA